MSLEDQDVDVEEEEEFHEVDEEKHKTSQESVSGSGERIHPPTSQIKDTSAQEQSDHQAEPCAPLKSTETIAAPATTTTTSTTFSTIPVENTTETNSTEGSTNIEIIEPTDDVKQIPGEFGPTSSTLEVVPTTTHETSTPSSLSPVTAATNTNPDTATDSKAEDASTSAEANSQSESSKNVDWANIMRTSNKSGESGGSDEDDTTNDGQSSRGVSPDDVRELTSELDEIIAKAQDKLKIQDDTTEIDSLVVEATDSKLDLSSLDEPSGTICEDADETEDKSHNDDDSLKVSPGEANKSEDNNDEQVKGSSEEKGEDKAGEEVEKKELDLDEDVKNPQYIPKKGVFYEHDDRSHDIDDKKQSSTDNKEEENADVKDSGGVKKAPVQEKPNDGRRNNRRQRTEADKWNHDLFRDEKQKPKSKTELINAYGYDIRQERSGNQNDNRAQRGNNNTSGDKVQPAHDNQRSRQGKDGGRLPRQHQAGNRSRETRPRRQNPRNNNNTNRNDNTQLPKRDGLSSRPTRPDIKDGKETSDEKQPSQASSFSSNRRDQEFPREFKNTRNDSRGRRRNSRDRPNVNTVDDKAPVANAMMAPITIWSSEDMVKAEAFKDGPPKQQQSVTNSNQRNRPTDFWQQGQPMKNIYQDKSIKNPENENRQHYNARGRYQDRADDTHKPNQFVARNQYNDRSNIHSHDWHRTNNYSPYNKSNDYIVKTQTFENSRLSQQANINRSNNRDLRDVLNERRMHGHQNHQNYQPKNQLPDQHLHSRGQIHNQHMHHQQYVPSQQQHMMHHQQPPHMMHSHHHHHPQQLLHQQHHHQQQQQQQQQSSSQQSQHQQQQPLGIAHVQVPHHQQPTQNHNQPSQSTSQEPQQQAQNQRQPSTSQPQSTTQSRQPLAINNMTESGGSGHDTSRLNSNPVSAASDLLNSRPIIKTETYTSTGVSSHQQHQQQQQPSTSQPIPQHSQNHRTMGGPMGAQQGPNPTGSHMVPSHLGAGASQAQYYSPPNSSRDPTAAAAALATAYHGYIPGLDTSRYHMTSQQLPDHGYIPTPGQTNVATASVLHQQGMYTDTTSAGGTVASSAYMGQAGSTLSPSSNIPVTGAGPPPLPPVSYLQHSQYPPPPYSNPYSQPQHNQAPPQSSHAYPPYWSYI